jgi:hypothetical protein
MILGPSQVPLETRSFRGTYLPGGNGGNLTTKSVHRCIELHHSWYISIEDPYLLSSILDFNKSQNSDV